MNLIKSTTPVFRPSRTARCLACCRKWMAQMARVKASLSNEFRQAVHSHEHLLELALNEAEAVAWQTEYPQLVFPTLAAEKARAVAAWHARQVRMQTAPAVAAAAA